MRKNYPVILVAVIVVIILLLAFNKNKHNSVTPPPSSIGNTQTENLATQTPVPTPNLKTQSLRLFFVALNDDGKNGEKIGCGDTLAPVDIQLPETETPLQSVIQQLISTKQKTVGPSKLYNSLYQSKLQFKDADIKNGVATIHLTGTVQLGGECDNPRFQSQLEKTAGQFSNVSSVQIFINDKPLSEVISLK